MTIIFGIKYNRLHKRPTFEELISYTGPKVTYPVGSATISRDSPYLTQLDGIGMMELDEQQRRKMIER